MNVVNKYLFQLITIFMILYSCNNIENYSKKTYYPNSQKLKTIGTYKNNHFIGEYSTFYENGNIETISNYDTAGIRNGKFISFRESGDTDQIQNFKNDRLNGFVISYKENKLSEKSFFLNDKQSGDAYFFDSTGKCYLYDFIGFDATELRSIDYKSDAEYNSQVVISDSLISYYKINEDSSSISLALLISNPPQSSTEIYLEQIDVAGKYTSKDSIDAKHSYFVYDKIIKNGIKKLKITANQIGFKGKRKTLIEILTLSPTVSNMQSR